MLQDMETQVPVTDDADKTVVVEISSTTTLDLLVRSEDLLLSKGGSVALELGDSASEEEEQEHEAELVASSSQRPQG